MTETRKQYISRAVSNAMLVLSRKHPNLPLDDRPAHPICVIDWTLETRESVAQIERLNEAMARYVDAEGNDLNEVTAEYKKYAELHKRWFFGAIEVEAPK